MSGRRSNRDVPVAFSIAMACFGGTGRTPVTHWFTA